MTKRVYKTALGNTLDIGALILQNENVRAVGNMKINARGDKINVNGDVTVTRSEQVNKNLKRLRSNTKSEPVLSSQPKTQPSQNGISAAIEKAKKRK
jgi:hypothetical protein